MTRERIGTVDKVFFILLMLFLAPTVAAQEQEQVQDQRRRTTTMSQQKPGIGVDSSGGPAVDPTKNVLDLVEAAIRRQDDLRTTAEKLSRVQFETAEKLNDLRYKQTQDLAAALATKLADEAKLHASYAERLAIAEAKRIDAIRAVDVNAVVVANQRTSEQATALQTQTTASAEVLRNQVARSAEDLRALVATTAATALQNQQQQFTGISTQISSLSTRLTTLEQAGAEGKGKQTFQDPVIAQLLTEFRAVANREVNRTGIDSGRSDMAGWIAAGASFFIMMLIGLGAIAVNAMRPAKPRS